MTVRRRPAARVAPQGSPVEVGNRASTPEAGGVRAEVALASRATEVRLAAAVCRVPSVQD